MSLFRKARPQQKEFPLKIDVLNYSPAAYWVPQVWVEFLSSIEGRMKGVLAQTSPDELNAGMFDALIEAALREARASVLRQKMDHLSTIHHDQKVLEGELAEVRALRQDLGGALDEVLQQLAECGVHATTQTDCRRNQDEQPFSVRLGRTPPADATG